jgi:hypothetical protein
MTELVVGEGGTRMIVPVERMASRMTVVANADAANGGNWEAVVTYMCAGGCMVERRGRSRYDA